MFQVYPHVPPFVFTVLICLHLSCFEQLFKEICSNQSEALPIFGSCSMEFLQSFPRSHFAGNHRWCREMKCQLFSHTRTCSPVYRSRTTKITTLFYCVNHNRSLCKHHHFVSLRRILVHHQNFLLRRTSINLNCSNT